MDGRMFEYDAERNLVAFRSGNSSDMLLFLGKYAIASRVTQLYLTAALQED